MVDVMAPVFDRREEEEEERARMNLPREDLWQRDAQGADAGRRIRSERGHRLARDGGSDDHDDDAGHGKKGDRQKEAQKSGDNDNDNDNDNDGDGNGAGAGGPGGSLLGLTIPNPPLNPLAALVNPSLPALLGTSEVSTATTSSSSLSLSSTSSLSPSPTPSSTSATTSASTSNAAVAFNPQVSIASAVTTSSVAVITTTTSAASQSSTRTPSFIDSIFPSSTSSSTTSSEPTALFASSMPTPTLFVSDTGDDPSDHRDDSHHDDHNPPGGGLSPTAEDVLISAGSIGAFILVCFICWMGWRMYKKSQRVKSGMYDDEFSSPNGLLSRIPYLGRNQRGWQDLDGRGSPPMYEGPKSASYSMTDGQNMTRSPAKQVPMNLPQLDTNVPYSNLNPFSASSAGTHDPHRVQSPQSTTLQGAVPYPQQPVVVSQSQANLSPANQTTNPFVSPVSLDPGSAAQYGAGTMQTIETVTSDRSRMPDPIYNQSELARQASTAYDPAKRAVYRASELSSISSGFGDGDIIVPPPAALQHGQDSRPLSFAKSAGSLSRRNSVANRSDAGTHGQRDTVYTTTSEDMPVRYRSVNSWVNQQTGRIQRQQQRAADEEVPPVPSLPPEERYTLMMDDEEPRRYEDTLSSQPPVPSLPPQNNNAGQ